MMSLLLHHAVALSLPVLLTVEEVRWRRRPLAPVPSRSPVRNPSDPRILRPQPLRVKAG